MPAASLPRASPRSQIGIDDADGRNKILEIVTQVAFGPGGVKKPIMQTIISPRPEMIQWQRQQARRELRLHYAAELAHAGFWRRLMIDLRIEREVAAEMKRRFPPGALHASCVLALREGDRVVVIGRPRPSPHP